LNVLGSLVLDVDSNRLDVKFLDDQGGIRDYFTLIKGPLPTPPLADFDAAPRSGSGPLSVQFVDLAANIPTSWEWDFESDGLVDSTLQHPSHMYAEPGFYAVRQTVSNSLGADEMIRVDYICVTDGIPTEVTDLRFETSETTFSWQPYPGANSYDVIKGDVGTLQSGDGDVGTALIGCIAENTENTEATDAEIPSPGEAFFYLVRATTCAKQQGTYDTAGPGQISSRDPALLGMANICSCDLIDDLDGDAICDAEDLCPIDENNDADGDGLCGEVDNCPSSSNPDQEDLDDDGIGDPCDICPIDFDNDIDADSVCGDVDNCPTTSNAGQENLDGDGYGNACDPCPADAANDIDADTFCGDVDNCPLVTNPGQEDGDDDGIGDVCDSCVTDPENDVDGDNYCGDVDNCSSVYNVVQVDTDLDGVGDLCDNCPEKSNASQEDSDGDGAGSACDCRPNKANTRQPGEVMEVIAIPSTPRSLVLGWREAVGSDSYSVTRGVGPLASGDYGPCLVSGLNVPTVEDAEEPAVGQVFYYQVQGESTQCGLGAMGYTSSEQQRINTNPAACTE
jgi:PKD repeat protein